MCTLSTNHQKTNLEHSFFMHTAVKKKCNAMTKMQNDIVSPEEQSLKTHS